MILRCSQDYIWSSLGDGLDHKEAAGLMIVTLDIICVVIMFYMINKLEILNNEYLEIMDNNVILMSKFTIQINQFQLSSKN